MNHTWRAGGSGGKWVHHSSGGSGSDSIGVGLGNDVLGPYGSVKLARITAAALNDAYELGQRGIAPDDVHEALDRAYSAMGEGGSAQHASLEELAGLLARMTGYEVPEYQPLTDAAWQREQHQVTDEYEGDGQSLIAGVLYDDADGYEADYDDDDEDEDDEPEGFIGYDPTTAGEPDPEGLHRPSYGE